MSTPPRSPVAEGKEWWGRDPVRPKLSKRPSESGRILKVLSEPTTNNSSLNDGLDHEILHRCDDLNKRVGYFDTNTRNDSSETEHQLKDKRRPKSRGKRKKRNFLTLIRYLGFC